MRRVVSGFRVPHVDNLVAPLLSGPSSQAHLAWLSRKFSLGQDALLLSSSPRCSTSYVRLLVLRFAQLCGLELEHVTLSESTRENDLKQSRDICGGATVYRDEAVVRALLHGRLLLLDGLHRVEANVLPILNSLLEAREMQLDDGRLIISHQQFQHLLQQGNTETQLHRGGLLACHPDFRVCAIALPCPPFAGTALDPPLRSRLQARYVREPPIDELGGPLRANFAPDIVSRALNVTASLVTAASAPPEARPKVPDPVGFTFSLPLNLSKFWGRFPLESGDNAASLVERHVGPGSDLAKLFGESAKQQQQQQQSFIENVKKDLELERMCTIASFKGTVSALQLARELSRPVEVLTCFPQMSMTDLFAARGGSIQETVWLDSALVRAMKSGAVCVIEQLESCPSLLPAIENALTLSFLHLPGGQILATKAHIEQCSVEHGDRVTLIHPDFRVVLLSASPENPLVLGPVHRVPPLTFDRARSMLLSSLPSDFGVARHEQLVDALSKFLVAAHAAKKQFSIENARATVLLADKGGLDPAQVVGSCFLLRFLAPTSRAEIEGLIAGAGFPKMLPAAHFNASMATSRSASSEDFHLVPSSLRFVDNVDSSKVLSKIEAYLHSNLPILLLGVQGVGKNAIVDKALTKNRLARQYIQLHLDSTVQSLFSQTVISNGILSMQDSPLLIAAVKGHVCVLDECDKASPQVVASLKGLVGGLMRLPDGRTLVSAENKGLVAAQENDEKILVVHPDFRLIMLANPGVAPFLGSNVLETLGSLTNCILMESPSILSMQTILKQYAKRKIASDAVERVAAAFADLTALNLAGDLSYAYGLREAISVVKDLNETENLDSALANVFDYELQPEARRRIADVLHTHKLKVQDSFTSGPGKQLERAQIGDAVPRESEQDPKHGKKSDGKEHVGGNTWEGGTGGSSTAGLGGRHGPYRLDLGKFDVHQVRDEDKVWTDPAAEARARQMAKDGLQRRLKEIGLAAEEFDAYIRYQKRVATEAGMIQGLVKQMSSNKTSSWTRLLEGGVLDESRLVDALAGDSRVFKRLTKGKKNSSVASNGKVFLRFCFDCSGSMYRFNSFDQRLEKLLEVVCLVMEGFSDSSERVFVSVSGHSGEEKKVDLLDGNAFPLSSLKDRYAVLQRIVAHAQYCWSGDNTLPALQTAVSELEGIGTDLDSRYVFVVSDANFRRYGISTKRISTALTSSPKVEAALLMVGQLGEEADQLARELPQGKAYVCRKSGDLSNILFLHLVSAVSRKSHLD